VIGGSGFIGRFVTRELERRGSDVTVFHRSASGSVREILGDRKHLTESADALRAAAPDIVIDLILSSGSQARDLMTVFRGVARRIVAISSADVYRACGVLHRLEPGPLEPLPLRETSALRTRLQTYPPSQLQMVQQLYPWIDDEYDKIPVEREVMSDPHLPGTVLRLPMVYGPGDPLHRFYGLLKRMDDQRPAILIDEAYAAWRSPRGYVENVAAAIALAAVDERAAGEIFNVAEAETFPELEWATMIARHVGWTGRFVLRPFDAMPEHLRMPGDLRQHWVVDSTKIRATLDYAEQVPRDVGIARTIEWERTNPPTGFTPHRFDYAAEDVGL
jgi:nucleoside-diphosphate-sugar epimerase